MIDPIRVFLVSIFIALLPINVAVNAASFDCGKANTATEKAICADSQLSKLDEVLAELYFIKRSINYSSDELSTMADTSSFPEFLRSNTRAQQVEWIEGIQEKCYGVTNCLVDAYLNRIKDFFHVDIQQDTRVWRMLAKLDHPNDDYSTSIWSYNNNDSNEPGCFSDDFQGVFYIVAVYDRVTRKLITSSPNLIDPKDNGCLEYEIEITPTAGDAVSIAVGSWMSAGSWGRNTHVYNFQVAVDEVYLTSYRYHEFARNVHLFQTKSLDFEESLFTLDLYNGSDEIQSIFGVELNPEDEFVIKRDLQKLRKLNFHDVNQFTMYELMDSIQEQLQLEP